MESSGISDGRMTLDWLAFTLPFDDGLKSAEFLFGELTPRPVGTKGYSHSAELPCGGVVSWSPERPEQKVHVELGGRGLGRAAELDASLKDIKHVLKWIQDVDGVITRVDFALDDRAGRLSLDVIGEHVDQELLTSRWRKGRKILATLAGQGRTFEFGSRRSDCFLRIYDKQAEQLDKGKDDPGEWVRVELELKREKANEVVGRYIQEGVAFVVGLLRGLIEFKERGEDQTKTRWATCAWWGAFLEWAEKARLSLPKVQPSVERSMAWMDAQWPRTIALVTSAEGGCFERVYALVAKGVSQLKPSDHMLIAEYQARLAA
jgi:hypothetical protein